MLAYVFWHWPNARIDSDTYESGLRQFQSVLSDHKPDGFQRSVVFRIHGAPWLPPNVVGYEDWYIVDGSGALDVLNEAAITAPRKDTHDRAAQRAAGGTAGLYRLRRGQLDVDRSRFAAWLSKPVGTPYDNFYSSLSQWTDQPGSGLWGRQMVLGPTPEFCLLSPDKIILPDALNVLMLPLERVWPLAE